MCRVGGMGYRGLSTLSHRRSKRYARLWSMFTKSMFSNSLELWLGHGRPLNPYWKGIMVDYLRTQIFPRDIKIAPESIFLSPQAKDLQEYKVLRWVNGVSTYTGTQKSRCLLM